LLALYKFYKLEWSFQTGEEPGQKYHCCIETGTFHPFLFDSTPHSGTAEAFLLLEFSCELSQGA
ncbi:hypothetical protein PENNAL_c0706G09396, partial [Penicillium nalgiovense]